MKEMVEELGSCSVSDSVKTTRMERSRARGVRCRVADERPRPVLERSHGRGGRAAQGASVRA
jgi:hypothetical protein